jgi:uncharacterized protein YdhG (YjbR/CyaY superfamily)
MQSNATTVDEYLGSLPDDRRDAIEQVREVILANLDAGFEEAMNWGMITYQVPLETYPDTYNGQPLMFASLASQKNHMAVYLMSVYSDHASSTEFEAAYRATGKKLDMGKSCVRFRRIEDLPLELIGSTIAATSAQDYVDMYESTRGR